MPKPRRSHKSAITATDAVQANDVHSVTKCCFLLLLFLYNLYINC